MKSISSSLLFRVLVLAIGVLGAYASPTHAQAAANGTFSLPHETNWGGLVLPAGAYAFSLQSKSWPAPIVVGKAGGSQLAIVFPRLVSRKNSQATADWSFAAKPETRLSARCIWEVSV